MSKARTFYRCELCGNIAGMIENTGSPLTCCGQAMRALIPNENDPTRGLHSPAVEISGDICEVRVGLDPHSMTEEHHIAWIYVLTENGGQRRNLSVGAPAVAKFALVDDKVTNVYSYCNVHGLKMVTVD